jgi:tryptophanase
MDDEILNETLAEPFRIKVVEYINLPDRAERERVLREAFYSMFYIKSKDVYIDLLTDSGSSAMSDRQWAGLMLGDEAYVGSRNYFNLVSAVQEIFNYQHVVPAHQGRAAENVLLGVLIKSGDMIPGNSHFDTTRAHIEDKGGKPLDLISDSLWDFDEELPFKGNIDLEQLKVALKKYHDKVPFILLTVVNNTACSAPVSMENIRETKKMADEYDIPVFFDACRFAENCFFIKTREKGYREKSIIEISRELFSYGDGCFMSAKKDALVNIGGFVAMNDEDLFRKCQERLVLYEGFPTYGGLARRDLEAVAVGLREGVDENYLRFRTQQVAYLGNLFEKEANVKISKPTGGSGVFVDVSSVYPHLTSENLPGIALTCDLYTEGGIRIVAIPFSLNRINVDTGTVSPERFEFARFAIPRRVYTKSHMDYVATVMKKVKENALENKGFKVSHWPPILGHFFAKFEPQK